MRSLPVLSDLAFSETHIANTYDVLNSQSWWSFRVYCKPLDSMTLPSFTSQCEKG